MPTAERTGAPFLTPNEITDPGDAGAIPVGSAGYVNLVSAGAETRTMAAPIWVGQEIQLNFITDAGDVVVTVASTVNQTGNNTITFADIGDMAVYRATQTGTDLEWREVMNDGAALTTV